MRHPRPARLARAGAAGIVLAGMSACLAAGPAWAHADLVGTLPQAGSTAAAVDRVELHFSEELLDLGPDSRAIVVTGPDGAARHFELGCAQLLGPDEAAGPGLAVDVALGAPGRYRVDWRGVTREGHVVRDTYLFEYTGAALAEGTAAAPCGADATAASVRPAGDGAAAAAGPAGTDAAAGAAGSAPGVLPIAAAVLAFGLVAGGVALGVRRRLGRAARESEAAPSS